MGEMMMFFFGNFFIITLLMEVDEIHPTHQLIFWSYHNFNRVSSYFIYLKAGFCLLTVSHIGFLMWDPKAVTSELPPVQVHPRCDVFSNQTSARLPEQAGNAVGGTTMTRWELRKEAPVIERCRWSRFELIGTITWNVIQLGLFHLFLLKFGWYRYPNISPFSAVKKRVHAIGGPWAGGSNAKQWGKLWWSRIPWCKWCATLRIFAQRTWNPVIQSLATSNTDTLRRLAGSLCIWRSKMALKGHGQWRLCFHRKQKTTVGDFFSLWRWQKWCRRLPCTCGSLNFGMASQA